MQGKYIKSRRADRDIERITARSFIDFGERQTLKYIDSLTETLQKLADDPERGRVFSHVKTGREYHYHKYVSHVISYRKRKNDVFIVRILHKKMLPEKHL